jgi:hypothetical protein
LNGLPDGLFGRNGKRELAVNVEAILRHGEE